MGCSEQSGDVVAASRSQPVSDVSPGLGGTPQRPTPRSHGSRLYGWTGSNSRAEEPRIQRALSAGYGPEIGREATLEAFEYGWEHWNRIQDMSNPAGYLYRVGSRCATRLRRNRESMLLTAEVPSEWDPWVEPGLDGALDQLTSAQRTVVVLIHGFGWTYQEVSELLGVRRSTVQRHADRALSKLRSEQDGAVA